MSKVSRAYLDKLRCAAGQTLKQQVHDGELLPAPRFAKRLGASLRQLARLEDSGGVFSIAVDGTPYYPALLASPLYDRRRLRKICRIIFPAPASMRREYLTTAWGSLGTLTPLDALQTDVEYRRLLKAAKRWAAQWWRTTVEIYSGSNTNADAESEAPVCTGTVEQDPRVSVCRRAVAALSDKPNMRPDGPYPRLNAATVLVTRDAVGMSDPVQELRFDVTVYGNASYASIWTCDATTSKVGPVPIDEGDDIVAVVRKLLTKIPTGAKP
ncbi:hypothetical protein [Burkholderia aenigmatica]|uniref:hypothetical protein n=1 Tax=Burkholderia aenigmatica TaxID=2015348 RepID=UPI001178AD55|nr:hypothetical protein [Burkholderia aenigmatica]